MIQRLGGAQNHSRHDKEEWKVHWIALWQDPTEFCTKRGFSLGVLTGETRVIHGNHQQRQVSCS